MTGNSVVLKSRPTLASKPERFDEGDDLIVGVRDPALTTSCCRSRSTGSGTRESTAIELLQWLTAKLTTIHSRSTS